MAQGLGAEEEEEEEERKEEREKEEEERGKTATKVSLNVSDLKKVKLVDQVLFFSSVLFNVALRTSAETVRTTNLGRGARHDSHLGFLTAPEFNVALRPQRP